MLPCEYCGDSESVLQEEEGLICSKCGAVAEPNAISWEKDANPVGATKVSEFQIKNQVTEISGFNHAYKFCTRGKKFTRKGSLKMRVFEFFKTICVNAKIPEYIKKRSEELLHEAYDIPYFIKRCEATKMILAGVCIFWHVREEQLPIPMNTMAKLTRCPLLSFGCVYNELKKLLQVPQQTAFSIENYAESFCHKHNLDSSVKNILLSLIPIYKEASKQNMCKPDNMIVPLAYISYMASGSIKKPSMTFGEFCQKHKVEKRESLFDHCHVTLKLFAVMCERLPWVDKVEKSSKGCPQVWFYIQDLIKHMRSVLKDVSTATANESNGGGLKRKADVIEATQNVELTYRRCHKRLKKRSHQEEEEHEEITHDLDSELLVEEDMTEEELSQHIRTDEEVLQIKNSVGSDDD